MINIEDIRNRYKKNPEPKEIKEVRELITNSFSNLEFIEDVHKYFIPDGVGGKIELPSVSSVITQWEPYVDWDEKAETKAKRLGITKEELLKEWHEKNIISTSRGSKTHFYGENLMNMFIGKEDLAKKNLPFQYVDGYLIPYSKKEEAVEKYYLDIFNNPDVFPVMPEAMIYTNYNNKYKIRQPYAGTFDILLGYRMNNKINFAIHDFKTNVSLYKDFSRDRDIMMLEPFGSLGFYEEPFSHYSVQLSLYQIGLMQLDIPIKDRKLVWLKEDGEYEKYKTPDLTETLLDILK